MNASPQVSVLMSVRNGLPYAPRAINSIVCQTFGEWEFVIVDNASTDRTVEEIEFIAATESRIRLIRSSSDLGHSGGLNKGLEICRGPWVARIDADDVALPNRLERQLDFLRKNPDVQVTSCFGYYIDQNDVIVGNITHDLTTREAFRRYVERQLAIGILHPGALISRDLLLRVRGYRGAFDPANDIDLWGRLVDAGALILVQPEPLMKYRVHDGSISAHSFRRNRLKYQWARDCMRSRRRAEVEPAWDEYVASRESASFWKKLNRWRRASARQLYRQSGQHFISRRVLQACCGISLAIVLQPSYAIRRFLTQRLGGNRWNTRPPVGPSAVT